MKITQKVYCVIYLLFCACASDPLTIDAQNKTGTWDFGRPYTEVVGQKFKVRAAPVSSLNYDLIFDVEIINLSSEYETVDSTDFQLSGSALNAATSAVVPEAEIQLLESRVKSAEFGLRNSGFEIATDLILTIGLIFNGESDQERRRRLERECHQRYQEQAATLRIDTLRSQIDTYETKFIRKTTMIPGESLRGLVKFRKPLKEGLLQLSFVGLNEKLKLEYSVRK
jgi:hypothetical protein